MSYLLAHLAKRYTVALLTLERPGTRSFYPLPESMKLIKIDKLGGRWGSRLFRVASRPYRIRREVQAAGADVVISFMDTMNVTALLSCFGLGIPVVVSERNDPARHRIGRMKEIARALLYPYACTVVVQTRRIADYFPRSLQPKIRIIPNPIPTVPVQAQPEMPASNGRKRLTAVGSFKVQKGFDRLIDAFALIARDQPDWDLIVFGDGPQRPALEGRINAHRLEARVRLMGVTADIFGELAASHLLAFPSYYEGFPNALAEALAVGLPAIGHRGVSGVEELIVDGETGLLVDAKDGPAGLAWALSTLMSDGPLRAQFGNAARRHVAQWSPDRIHTLWDRVLAGAIGKR